MPAVYPELASAAGTTLSITTTPPASHDATGFSGVSDWENVGFVVNPGGLPRGMREYEDVDLLSGRTLVVVGAERMETIEVECVYQPEDLGQATVEESSDGKTIVWLRWRLPMGRDVFCAAYLTGYAPNIDSPTGYVGAMFTVKPIYDVEGIGAVYADVA